MTVIAGNMEQIKKEMSRGNLTPLYFTLSKSQYERLQVLRKEGLCKVMYILRYTAMYVINNTDKLKPYKDFDFSTKNGTNYKVDLPNDVYNEIKKISGETGFSMSRIMRIGLNDVLRFL